ncbi:hypothetical protein [Bacillus smithii]|uniref:hypothetical protein n=1 Tax=Bacillus smithii TaxID=1479 RepID=UPI003D2543C9
MDRRSHYKQQQIFSIKLDEEESGPVQAGLWYEPLKQAPSCMNNGPLARLEGWY